MFLYEKKLQFPVKVATPNPKLASFIISQYGGPDGELGAAMRYLSQRYAMPYAEAKGLLTDIGTEELGHIDVYKRQDRDHSSAHRPGHWRRDSGGDRRERHRSAHPGARRTPGPLRWRALPGIAL